MQANSFENGKNTQDVSIQNCLSYCMKHKQRVQYFTDYKTDCDKTVTSPSL